MFLDGSIYFLDYINVHGIHHTSECLIV